MDARPHPRRVPAPVPATKRRYWLFRNLERVRIRHHLRIVEGRLRRRDVSHLPETLQRTRLRNLNRVHDYWRAGRFPRNTFVRDKRIPILVDGRGVPCAVGHLLAEGGASSVVEVLCRADNHVRIRDVTTGALIQWLGGSGLTQEEASAIQPSYEPELDLSVFTTVILATLLPFRLLAEVLMDRLVRAREWIGLRARMISTCLAVLGSVGVATAAVVSLSPTYGEPFAAVFRTSLLGVFLGMLLPLELLFAWLVSHRVSVPRWKRRAGTLGLTTVTLVIAILFGPPLVRSLARAIG